MQSSKKISVFLAVLVLSGLLADISLLAQNAPVSTIGVANSYGNTASVAVTGTNISNVGSYNLKILYDQTIAQPAAVTTGPLLGGSLSVNLTNPGIILVSWYTFPGLTLSGNAVIFTIDFNKVAFGTSAITWVDDGFSCAWYDGNSSILNDVPTASYYLNGSLSFLSAVAPHTIAPSFSACKNTVVNIPVKITGFNNIGKVTLTLNYDAAALGYLSFSNTSGFPGLSVDGTQPGTVVISGIILPGGNGITLADSSVLATLNFSYAGSATSLNWLTGGLSCQYTGAPPAYYVLSDTPPGLFYLNGSIVEIPMPAAATAITGPLGGNVCAGASGVNFSVSPVPNAVSYIWSLPPGAFVTNGAGTNAITVTLGNSPASWNVTVCGNNICGSGALSPIFPLVINTAPVIAVQPVSPDTVPEGAGSASFFTGASGSPTSYQWQEYQTSWNDLGNGGVFTGVFTPTLTITNPPATMNGNHYRCAVSGFCPPQAISNGEATLFVSTLTGINNMGAFNKSEGNTLFLSINPNPCTGEATLNYFLPADGVILIEIWNIFGKKINVIFSGNEASGFHNLRTSLKLNPGLYLITLTLQNRTDCHKVTAKLIWK